MGLLPAFLLLILAALIAFVILLVVGSIYFDATNSQIPPGVEKPAKLRILHVMLCGFCVLGKILENLRICSQIQFFRYLQNRLTQAKDSALFKKDVKFKGVPVRIYQPKAPSAGRRKGIIFFHGGGWVMDSIHTYDKMCCYFARESGSVVVSVDYHLAPEHKYPVALDDCLAATTHFLEAAEDHGVDPAQVMVAGDSAGGNLATAVCQALAGRPGLPNVRAQILTYPLLQGIDFNLPSYQQNRAVPLAFREQAAFNVLQYLKGDSSFLREVFEGPHVPVTQKLQYQKWLSADHIPKEFKARGYNPPVNVSCKDDVYEAIKALSSPGFSPLLAEDTVISQLPETCIVTCEYDVLRDDGLLYKKRLEDHRIPVTWYHIANGFHGILGFFDSGWFSFPSGKKGMDDIVKFIKSL
ncbi:arylacetamide deacetylase-like 3 [Tiliqua scincoides]|uniref:arylacetamide deacetylase-like 3 n=1 Tax=Tiliqua scincoides TaxID=71010 RepID=UPI00346323A3